MRENSSPINGENQRFWKHLSKFFCRGAKLTLHIKGVGEPASPVGNLIRHVVRDLHDGLVSVGGMGTRGYGRLKVGGSTVLQGLAPIDVTALLESVSVGEAKGESDGQA